MHPRQQYGLLDYMESLESQSESVACGSKSVVRKSQVGLGFRSGHSVSVYLFVSISSYHL